MFTSPAEIAFNLFSVPIHYYGLIMATAILCATFFTAFICQKYFPELEIEEIYNAAPFVIIASIIGARIYYCLLCSSYYLQNPIEILQIWHGGMSIHGGILGGISAGIIYAKRHNLNFAKYCDVFAFGIILGQIIGRWGNFFNSEAFGRPCSIHWFLKLYIPVEKRPFEYLQYQYFHPAFLYEIFLNIITLCIMLYSLKYREKLKSGSYFCIYLILYSIARIIVEQIRIDSVTSIAGIPVAQFISAIIIIISGAYLAKQKS